MQDLFKLYSVCKRHYIFVKQSFKSVGLFALIGAGLGFLLLPSSVNAAGISGEIEEVLVVGDDLLNNLSTAKTQAASVGTVLPHQLEHRPLLRPAEVLETIPGMVVTQHSGGGKANQYFLRGFNLDHSTDFATYFEGAPVNMVSHGHGQGYTDLNFLTPELISRMIYKKGPYFASEGDFSSAGSSKIHYLSQKNNHEITLSGGQDGYLRALIYGGLKGHTDQQNWVYAVSHTQDDGPWTNPDKLKRDNAFLKYTQGNAKQGYSLSGLYFDSSWQGTDQIPQRLVASGELGAFDTLDDTSVGDTHRYQLSYAYWQEMANGSRINANTYFVDYGLNLVSNFTYYASDLLDTSPIEGIAPRDIGDQIVQVDDRSLLGGSIAWAKDLSDVHQIDVGASLRHDAIDEVGVGSSFRGTLYSWASRAKIDETAVALHTNLASQWQPWLTSNIGLRFDHITVEVTDRLNQNDKAKTDDAIVSPKFSLQFGPFKQTDFFLNYGQGFHSNNAHGTVQQAAEETVPLISESTGYELGLRSNVIQNLQLSMVLFALSLDSELVFVGDEGTTEAQDSTRRKGIELSLYYQPTEHIVLDADYTHSKARFDNAQFDGNTLLGDYVPDSIEDVFSMGVSFEGHNGFYSGLRLRYFGPRNLTEAGDLTSSSSQMVNANIGYRFNVNALSSVSVGLEVLNLTDRSDDDITYWYASRTQAERDRGITPIEDFHSHPMIPRTVRASVSYAF